MVGGQVLRDRGFVTLRVHWARTGKNGNQAGRAHLLRGRILCYLSYDALIGGERELLLTVAVLNPGAQT